MSGLLQRAKHVAWVARREVRYSRSGIGAISNGGYRRALESATVVTFDVFDTALLRCVPQPSDVFEIVGVRMVEAGAALDAIAFRGIRIEAELEARALAGEAGLEEVTLADIYAAVGKRIPGLDASRAMEEELAVERAVLVANPDVLELYEALIEGKRRIAFVSDTYFSGPFVTKALAAAGYRGRLEVIASSDLRATKEHGRLWPLLAERFGVAPDSIVHLGDNVGVDVRSARRHGVRAFWYRGRVRDRSRAGDSLADKVIERTAALAASRNEKISAEERLLRRVSYDIVGPIFLGLGQWLARRVVEDRSGRVLFCARDGFFLRETYERFAAYAALPPAVYFEVSRRALVFPSMTALDDRALDVLCANNAPLEVAQYFARIGLDIARYPVQVEAAGLAPATRVYDPETRKRLRDLFVALAEPVLERARSERGSMLDYLQQCGVFEPIRLAVVDIGWGGTLQQALADVLVTEGRGSDLSGYYLSTDERISKLNAAAGPARGWFANGAQPAWMQTVISQGYWLFEIAFAAQHGTILGYRRDAHGTVAAVRHEYDAQSPNARAARAIHQASAELIDRWIRIFGGLGPPLPMTSAFERFRRFVHHPTHEEARFFGDMVHIGGLGTTTETLAIAAPPPMRSLIKRPRLLVDAYHESHWQLAFVQRVIRSNAAAAGVLQLREAIRSARIAVKRRLQRRQSTSGARS